MTKDYFDKTSEELCYKFLEERNIRKSTYKGYAVSVKDYCNFQKKPLRELLDEALKQQDAHIPLRESKLKQRLLNYREYLMKESGKSSSTVKTYFSKIKTVYTHFNVELPILPPVQYAREYVTTYSDLPTLNNLREALEVSTIDMKAVICFQVSSGSAKAEVLSLTVKQFFEGVQPYHNIKFNDDLKTLTDILEEIGRQLSEKEIVVPTFYLERIKTKKFYYTFCSPEASEHIVKYLKGRLVSCKDTKAFLKEKLFDFTSSMLLTKFQEINDYYSWGFKGKYRFFRSHVLRKWNASNIQMTTEDIDNIQGRAKDVVHEAYIKVKPERLKKTYMEHMWRVCISQEWRETCVLLDAHSKEELGARTPEEKALARIEKLLEEKGLPMTPGIGMVQSNKEQMDLLLSNPVFRFFDNLNKLLENVNTMKVPPNYKGKRRGRPKIKDNFKKEDENIVEGEYDKLLEYSSLLKEGLITKDEFNKIKESVFGG